MKDTNHARAVSTATAHNAGTMMLSRGGDVTYSQPLSDNEVMITSQNAVRQDVWILARHVKSVEEPRYRREPLKGMPRLTGTRRCKSTEYTPAVAGDHHLNAARLGDHVLVLRQLGHRRLPPPVGLEFPILSLNPGLEQPCVAPDV